MRRLEREPENRELHYFVQLAIFHEDMHAEAFHYTRQTLGYEDPFREGRNARPSAHAACALPTTCHRATSTGGRRFPAGRVTRWRFRFRQREMGPRGKARRLSASRASPVTNAEYLDFVQAGGYSRREWWSEDGWAWKSRENLQAPKYWAKRDGAWTQRRFDRVVALRPDDPVVHVSWHEAQAYCRYASRRLPTRSRVGVRRFAGIPARRRSGVSLGQHVTRHASHAHSGKRRDRRGRGLSGRRYGVGHAGR